MDIGRFEKQQYAERKSWADATEEEWNEKWNETPWQEDPWGYGAEAVPLSAVDTKCHKCGGVGHYASERPSKGTGTGKDSGGKTGGGKYGGKFGGKDSGGKNGGKTYGGKIGGKGLGKDGKGSAGRGKGQGPADGCWTCGGAHFSYHCSDCRPRQWTVTYSVCFGRLVQNVLQTCQE